MAAKHSAYRVALPELTQDQTQKLRRWCERCSRAYELTNGNQLVLLLGEQRTPKQIGNIIRIYLQRWGATLPKYQSNVVSGLSEEDFWKTVEPADLTQQILREVYESSGERLTKRQARYLDIAQSLARAVECAMAKNAKACTASAWHELAAPVRQRKEKEEQDKMSERSRRDAECRAERQRLLEEEKKQRETEDTKPKNKELEWDVKRARLSKEFTALTGIVAHLPYEMANVETLYDIPFANARLQERD